MDKLFSTWAKYQIGLIKYLPMKRSKSAKEKDYHFIWRSNTIKHKRNAVVKYCNFTQDLVLSTSNISIGCRGFVKCKSDNYYNNS